ncbi:MAG: DUF983 domain-containing protein [Alphaproteobacteria bacterium]|nr:DUF983 domain-containing protein [Alphaproteobacteria bacterium]
MDVELMKLGWACKCPRCRTGKIFKPGLTLELKEQCSECALDLSKNDSADGPAVFLIFILGFLLVPLALLLDAKLNPPLWVHMVLFGVIGLSIILGTLRPLKAYIIALQYKHRPRDWES